MPSASMPTAAAELLCSIVRVNVHTAQTAMHIGYKCQTCIPQTNGPTLTLSLPSDQEIDDIPLKPL